MKSAKFIVELFHNYYMKDFSLAKNFSLIEKREFGFHSFDRTMFRHIAFTKKEDLESFLQKGAYSDVYFSCAYYQDPEAEMQKKGWQGADLVFDIDADHIPTECDKIHDIWTCGMCGLIGKGVTPHKCPICGGEKFKVNTWPCDICLNSAKEATIKLLDILTRDFSLSKEKVYVFFSGHRGYHVHVESEAVKMLDTIARKEIVDYISGLGLDVFGGLMKNWRDIRTSRHPTLANFGWGKRLIQGTRNFILNAKEEDLRNLGLSTNIVKIILCNKELILKNCLDLGAWGKVKGVGIKTWKKIVDYIINMQSAKIDAVVTTDIHRLIRLTGTLHSKTGFRKVQFPISDINQFNPFKEAVAFKEGAVEVFVFDAPKFRLGSHIFGPYKDQKVELPTAAAVLLICKDKAKVLE